MCSNLEFRIALSIMLLRLVTNDREAGEIHCWEVINRGLKPDSST